MKLMTLVHPLNIFGLDQGKRYSLLIRFLQFLPIGKMQKMRLILLVGGIHKMEYQEMI